MSSYFVNIPEGTVKARLKVRTTDRLDKIKDSNKTTAYFMTPPSGSKPQGDVHLIH